MISPKTTGKNLHCKLLSQPLNMYITKSSEPCMLWRDVCDRNEALMMRILSRKYACMDAWITAGVATEIRRGDGHQNYLELSLTMEPIFCLEKKDINVDIFVFT